MLTPQQISQFRTQAGLSPTPPAPTPPDVQGILQQRKAALGGTPAPAPTNQNGTVGDFATNVNTDLSSDSSDFAHSITDTPQRVQDITKATGSGGLGLAGGVAESGLRAAGAAGKGLLDFAGDTAKLIPGVSQLLDHVSKNLSDQQVNADPNSPGQKIIQFISKLVQEHPEITKDIGAGANIAGAAGGFEGLKAAGESAPAIVQGAKDTVTSAVQGASDAATSIKNVVTGAKNGITDTANGLINGKTMEQILATPEKDVYKLSAPERKAFYDHQQQTITDARTSADTQTKANFDKEQQRINDTRTASDQKVAVDLQTKATESQANADALNRRLAVASRDETVALRPQIRTALAEQSKTYRTLVDEAIAPHANVPVSGTELKQFVDSRFPNDPGMAEAVSNKLGLNAKTVSAPLAPGELPSVTQGEQIAHGGQFNSSQADTTIGKIYEQTKGLKQDIGSAATKGTRVYTPDEKLTDDSIHTLSDFMKSKGVDMSEPNKFWAKYAPVRNQLVTEAKPFLQTPVQTKTFANTLTRIAKGTDVNNENFIGQVEELLGKPLATEQKLLVEHLTINQKQAIADEVAAQEAKLANKEAADSANRIASDKKASELAGNKSSYTSQSRQLNEKAFEATRLANRRAILKNVLKGAAGIVGAGEVIKHSPF